MLQHRQHKKLLAERRQSECTRLQAALKREPLSNGWGRERNRGWRPPVCVPLATKHPSWQTAESLLRLKAFNNRLDEEKGDLLYVARCRWEGETMTLQFWPKRQAKPFLWGIYLLTSDRKRRLLVIRNLHDAAQNTHHCFPNCGAWTKDPHRKDFSNKLTTPSPFQVPVRAGSPSTPILSVLICYIITPILLQHPVNALAAPGPRCVSRTQNLNVKSDSFFLFY